MAIDWKVKFTKKTNGHFSAIFNRFNTVAPEVMLETIPILDAVLDTPEQKEALWNQVFATHQEESSDAAEIAALESDGKIALLAKEPKE